MANQDQVDLLKQGVDVWNDWREDYPEIKIDLSDIGLFNDDNFATLFNVDLKGVNLRSANLSGSNFGRANLSNANLREADLIGADLSNANLREANLREADLIGVNLIGAKLNQAKLIGVNLTKANLSRANLSRANLNQANLTEANLRRANLNQANLIGANLNEANLNWADLNWADLNWANLNEANLNGAELFEADLSGLNARFAVVNGGTLLNTEIWDKNTDFSGVGLDSARVEGSLKSALKRNIRQKYWERRYKKNWLLNIVRPFWWASDYGSSTKRILVAFSLSSIIFSFLYLLPLWIGPMKFARLTFGVQPLLENFDYEALTPSQCSNIFGYGCNFDLWFRSLYFSVVTMTTLGFGDINAHPASMTGQSLVMIQVLIGYVLLGALITRLSILFQEVG